MKHLIRFEKWVDPLNSNVEEVEWPGFNQDADGDTVPLHGVKMQQILSTPFGMLSMLSNTMAHNQFDFWWMHTNFDITQRVKDLVKKIPGVETLEVFTRYRARLGIPKSGFFQASGVMNSIQTAITNDQRSKQDQLLLGLPPTVTKSVMEMRDMVDDKHDNWAILILPNGKMEVVASDKQDTEYKTKIELLTTTHSLVGGRLLTS